MGNRGHVARASQLMDESTRVAGEDEKHTSGATLSLQTEYIKAATDLLWAIFDQFPPRPKERIRQVCDLLHLHSILFVLVTDAQNNFNNDRSKFAVMLGTDSLVSSPQQRDYARSKLSVPDDAGCEVRGEFASLVGKLGFREKLGDPDLCEVCKAIRQQLVLKFGGNFVQFFVLQDLR